MIFTMTYSAAEWYRANPAALEPLRAQTEQQVADYLAKRPGFRDPEAFHGEALLAMWIAVLEFAEDGSYTLERFAAERVGSTLADEARRQDQVSKWRRAQLRAGLAEESPSDQRPLSLEELAQHSAAERAGWEADPHPGPEAQALDRVLLAEIREAMGRLEERQREVLLLYYLAGWTQAEIAVHLNVTQIRVFQIAQQALRRLRADLGFGTGDVA